MMTSHRYYGGDRPLPADFLSGWRAKAAGGARRALVLEGGAMRGAVALGGLFGMKFAGLEAPDTIYASSAGAIAAAYFVAGDLEAAARLYLAVLPTTRAISPWRWWRMLDLDYVFSVIRRGSLGRRSLPAHPVVVVAVTDANSGRSEFYDLATVDEPLLLLQASAALPAVAGGPVAFAGARYIDGGLAAVPCTRIQADGATHALVLLTHPAGYVRPKPAWITRRMSGFWLAQLEEGCRRRFLDRAIEDNACRDRVMAPSHDQDPVYWATIAPAPGEHVPSRLTRDVRVVRDAIVRGARRVIGAIFGAQNRWPPDCERRYVDFTHWIEGVW